MAQVRRTSSSSIWFGGAAFLADLTSALNGSVSISGTQSVVRRRALTSVSGRLGETATGEMVEMSATVTLTPTAATATDDLSKLLVPGNVRGIFFFDMRDAARAIAFPAICTTVPITSSTGSLIGYNATFAHDTEADMLGVDAARSATGGAKTLTAGQFGYQKTNSGVTGHTSTFTPATGAITVLGDGIKAEGA